MRPINPEITLEHSRAVINFGHFVDNADMHSPSYVDINKIYPNPNVTHRLCQCIASTVRGENIGVVVGQSIPDSILSSYVAGHLGEMHGTSIQSAYAEKTALGDYTFNACNTELVKTRPALIVQDLMVTGNTAKSLVKSIRKIGGEVSGVCVICKRGNVSEKDLEVGFLRHLVYVPIVSYHQSSCPLCKDGIPINTSVGFGSDFLARPTRKISGNAGGSGGGGSSYTNRHDMFIVPW